MNFLPQDGILNYFPNFLSENEANGYMELLLSAVEWRSDKIKMFGKEVAQPRLTGWYGDPGTVYTYSGLTMQPSLWTPALLDLKSKVEQVCEQQFNSVLLNLYRTGRDHMSYHADDERELGRNPTIASLSLGQERIFQIKHRHQKDLAPLKFDLESGSLIIMKGEMQKYWLHRINPTKKVVGPRINLTFRRIIL